MHSHHYRVTTRDQLYDTASQMQAPVLIHIDGEIEWSNRSFGDRFGVRPEASARIKIKELLWCIGVPEAVCGMVSEGVGFLPCSLPGANPGDSTILIAHRNLPMLSDGRRRMMLVLADEFDPEPADIN